jgi:acylphosphatase
MLTARRLLVSGRVQGVGFRWFVHDAAQREGISGWVRNLPDGRVEVFLEGDLEAVNRVDGKVRRGPSSARVQDVLAHDEPPAGDMREFHIK